MGTIARQVCLGTSAAAPFRRWGDPETILGTLRNYVQPDSPDHFYQQVTKFPLCVRTHQTTERYLLEIDVLRRRAEARVVTGGVLPDGFDSISYIRNAVRPRAEESI